jgi:hypothetical protein
MPSVYVFSFTTIKSSCLFGHIYITIDWVRRPALVCRAPRTLPWLHHASIVSVSLVHWPFMHTLWPVALLRASLTFRFPTVCSPPLALPRHVMGHHFVVAFLSSGLAHLYSGYHNSFNKFSPKHVKILLFIQTFGMQNHVHLHNIS